MGRKRAINNAAYLAKRSQECRDRRFLDALQGIKSCYQEKQKPINTKDRHKTIPKIWFQDPERVDESDADILTATQKELLLRKKFTMTYTFDSSVPDSNYSAIPLRKAFGQEELKEIYDIIAKRVQEVLDVPENMTVKIGHMDINREPVYLDYGTSMSPYLTTNIHRDKCSHNKRDNNFAFVYVIESHKSSFVISSATKKELISMRAMYRTNSKFFVFLGHQYHGALIEHGGNRKIIAGHGHLERIGRRRKPLDKKAISLEEMTLHAEILNSNSTKHQELMEKINFVQTHIPINMD